MKGTSRPKAPRAPVLGVGDSLGAGDSYLVTDMLPPELADVAFGRLMTEVQWQTMYHRGGEVPRLVAVEGEVAEDGSYPVYRHPSDESPPLSSFTPTVSLIREHVQKILNHPVNHVLIQLYRSGKDHISEHSDKTVDVVRGSNIVNVSLGAQRVMTLRFKKDKKDKAARTPGLPEVSASSTTSSLEGSSSSENQASIIPGTPRISQRIPLPHDSMFVMGLETNARWLHGINPDNRFITVKSPEEQLEQGSRISLTFRYIGTFLTKDGSRIWGQGAKNKMKEEAALVVDDAEEGQRILYAFGDENQKSNFDWEVAYGVGFDVLHLNSITNTQGSSVSGATQLLQTGTSLIQEFEPLKNVCGFLNAFHLYADDQTRVVEAHHYCSQLNKDIRQCLIYDSNVKDARLIGVEYMITPALYESLEPSERQLWHSHVFEVKSGMLVMPKPSTVPESVWEIAETKEMEEVIQLYGKTFHLWQVDRGDKLPLGTPQLMTSMTERHQVHGFWEKVADRDRRLGSDYMRKREVRKDIKDGMKD